LGFIWIKNKLMFNPKPSTILHLDLNSCFATIEQQANPFLRGKPIAVAAYASPNGCILAPSVEAKRYGIKTGMRVKDGKMLYPALIVLPPDPWKYRNIHLSLRKLLARYTNDFAPKSIDEFVLNLEGYPARNASHSDAGGPAYSQGMHNIGMEIKKRIKQEVGEWLTVSVGIAPNRYLAKTAASLHKPDGLDEINQDNYLDCYLKLKLTDLCGIKEANAARLASMKIFTVMDFYNAPVWKLKAAFHSITGYYWWLRLRGYEIDDMLFGRRSYGNSYALPARIATQSVAGGAQALAPILAKLVEKTGFRLRKAGYRASGVHLGILFRDHSYWHKGVGLSRSIFDSRDIYKAIHLLLLKCPKVGRGIGVTNLAESCFGLTRDNALQLELFDDVVKRKSMVAAIDKTNKRWGDFVITSARMAQTAQYVPDRIAFGNVKELEEFTFS